MYVPIKKELKLDIVHTVLDSYTHKLFKSN